jgi:hypothetical protein
VDQPLKSWRQNYLRVDPTSKMTPPPIFLDPVYRSGSTILLYYLKTYFDMNKSLRNLTPFRQHVLLLYVSKILMFLNYIGDDIL